MSYVCVLIEGLFVWQDQRLAPPLCKDVCNGSVHANKGPQIRRMSRQHIIDAYGASANYEKESIGVFEVGCNQRMSKFSVTPNFRHFYI